MNIIRIRANYYFWEHPIRWLIERKTRKIIQDIANYEYNHGLKERIENITIDKIINGYSYIHNGKKWVLIDYKLYKPK